MAKEAHAVLAPSKAEIWFNCHGSVQLGLDIPDPSPNDSAIEGTLCHDEINLVLINKKKVEDIADEEMREHVSFYTEWLAKSEGVFFKSAPADCVRKVLNEYRVQFTKNCWGTLDRAMYWTDSEGKSTLAICDYKYGRRHRVDAWENLQLLTYMSALIFTEKLVVDKCYIFIYQPRCGKGRPWDVWVLEAEEIKKWVVAIRQATLDIDNGDVTRNYGSWCQWCKAKVKCPEFQQQVSSESLIALSNTPITMPEPATLNVDQLVRVFRATDHIEQYLSTVRGILTTRLQNKLPAGGLKLVDGRSQRQWDKQISIDTIAKELKKLGVKEPFAKKLKGIGEVEKLVGKGVLGALTCKTIPPQHLTVPEDPRPAITRDNLTALTDLEP